MTQISTKGYTDTATSGDAEFAALLDEYTREVPQHGLIMQGLVLRITEDSVFLDVGAKRDAIIPLRELESLGEDAGTLTTGDHLPIYIEHIIVGDELLSASLEKGLTLRDWQAAERAMQEDETLELKISGYNKGGLLVDFGRLQGFVPNSHIPSLRYADDRGSLKTNMFGQTLMLKVIDVDQPRRRLVMSAKAAQKDLRKARFEELQIGEIVKGRVVGIAKFGAFVDLNGVTGLVHISNLAYRHVEHPSEVVNEGDEIEVMVESIDVERERIGLNLKAVIDNPWVEFAKQHEIDERIVGTVVNITNFGIFVRMPNGIDGLVHVTDMHSWMAHDVHNSLREGDQVLAVIKMIDVAGEKLRLSLREVSYEEELEWMRENQMQDEAETEQAEEVSAEAENEQVEEVSAEAPESPEAEIEPVELEEQDTEIAEVVAA